MKASSSLRIVFTWKPALPYHREMLSYRHAFHAGNHADVLKHIVLLECLSLLRRKEKGILAVDTHAGAGAYALDAGYAAQNREWENGVAKLRAAEASGRPRVVADYLSFVESFAAGEGGAYPGSPEIIAGKLRPQDRAVFCELHPADQKALEARFAGDRAVRIRYSDGFAELKAILPPPTRRGLVFIDPSYELASDYERLLEALRGSLKRFAEGVFIVWHPLLEREEARALPTLLEDMPARSFLAAELRLYDAASGERGMAGSGLFVVNPPWTLEESLREALPYLSAVFGSAAKEPWSIRSRERT